MMDFGLRDWARRSPERPALRMQGGDVVSYAALEALANRIARLIRAAGLRRGDHFATIFGNDPHMLASVWAAYRTGVYFTPIANSLAAPEIAYVVGNSHARLVLADARFGATVGDLPASVAGVSLFACLGGAMPGWERLEARLAALSADPVEHETPGAMMLYSSGTTGAPKGIWRPLPTAEQIGDGPPPFARDIMQIFGIDAATRYLSPAPLYHAAPLRFALAVSAAGGASVIMDKFDASTALDLLAEHEVTMSQWVPTTFQRLLALPEDRRRQFRAPAHKTAIHGAAPCPPAVKRAIIDWWGPILTEYYGGSESIGTSTIDSFEWLRRPGSVGRVAKGIVHILDDSRHELPPRRIGAVYFSGTSKFEYFGEPDKTAARTSPQGFQTIGDFGSLDEEGYLFLSDRMDDMIISGGVNLYPREIELAIEEAAGVAESAVVGVADETFGEAPVAFVVRARPGPDDDDFVDGLRTFCHTRLGKTKQVKAFHIIDALPRSATGKLLRRQLRDFIKAEDGAG